MDYEKLTVSELRKLAKEKNISIPSGYKKADIVELLKNNGQRVITIQKKPNKKVTIQIEEDEKDDDEDEEEDEDEDEDEDEEDEDEDDEDEDEDEDDEDEDEDEDDDFDEDEDDDFDEDEDDDFDEDEDDDFDEDEDDDFDDDFDEDDYYEDEENIETYWVAKEDYTKRKKLTNELPKKFSHSLIENVELVNKDKIILSILTNSNTKEKIKISVLNELFKNENSTSDLIHVPKNTNQFYDFFNPTGGNDPESALKTLTDTKIVSIMPGPNNIYPFFTEKITDPKIYGVLFITTNKGTLSLHYDSFAGTKLIIDY